MGKLLRIHLAVQLLLHLVLKGRRKQVEIFGESVRHSYEEGPEDTRHIKKWLANMFGDYYT